MGCCCSSIRFMSLEALEDKQELSAAQTTALRSNAKTFNRVDRLILYPIIIILLIDIFAWMYRVSLLECDDNFAFNKKSLFLGQCIFLVIFALIMTIIRCAIFKYYLLQPVISIWHITESFNITGIWMFSLSALSFLVAIGFKMAVVAIVIMQSIDLAILFTILCIVFYILCSLFYRLHVSSYIKFASQINPV